MKIAITGTSGHIAASLLPLLTGKGYHLRALIHQTRPQNDPFNVELVYGNLMLRSSLKELVSGCDIVIHCAAKISINSNHDPSVYETNVTGTKSIFEESRQAGVKRFIHVSSIHAYQQLPSGELLNESRKYCSDKAPRYDQSKRDAEQYVLQQASSKMEAVVLNPTAVVGPNDHRPSLMGRAIMDLYQNKVPVLISGGFDFCDVRDVANGIFHSIEKGRNANSYLLSGQWMSLREVHQLIMEIKSENRHITVLPAWTAMLGLPFIQLIARIKNQPALYTKESLHTLMQGNRNISSRKALSELGYKCRPLKETFSDSIDWFKKAGMMP